jgi:hypothetical protein
MNTLAIIQFRSPARRVASGFVCLTARPRRFLFSVRQPSIIARERAYPWGTNQGRASIQSWTWIACALLILLCLFSILSPAHE